VLPRLRVVHTRGRGAAEARNAGAAAASASLLLFLDDDVVAGPDLVRRHLERHAQEADGAIVVGPYLPSPAGRSLASSAAALWWNDLFQALERSGGTTYAGALTGNMSVSRAAFIRSGGFDAGFGRYRREDWEWGVRALQTGLSLHYAPTAQGAHEYELDAQGRLRAAELEGYGDVLLLRAHPEANSAMLPLANGVLTAGGRTRELQRVAWTSPFFRRAVLALLAALERGRLRLAWVRVFNVAQRLSYQRGVHAAGPPRAATEEPLIDIDLDGTEAIPPPSLIAPTLRVCVDGREVARVRPAFGQWTPDLAEQIVDAAPWTAVERAAASTGCRPRRDEVHDRARETLVLFGPANDPSDAVHRDELVAGGSKVIHVAGDASEHWRAIAAAARDESREFVALTMPGIRPDPRWLEEALVAFDGASVGAVLGCGLAEDEPSAPLVLHARSHAPDDLRLDAVTTPHYVVLRRALLSALDDELAGCGALAPVFALVEQVLDDGCVVAYRDVHGLSGAGPSRFEGARSLTAVRMRRSTAPRATALVELRRSTLVAAWHLLRRRNGRGAAEAYAGTLMGLLHT
jgi:GT2 family glycosyltransferase